jgi:hypothetical protein
MNVSGAQPLITLTPTTNVSTTVATAMPIMLPAA